MYAIACPLRQCSVAHGLVWDWNCGCQYEMSRLWLHLFRCGFWWVCGLQSTLVATIYKTASQSCCFAAGAWVTRSAGNSHCKAQKPDTWCTSMHCCTKDYDHGARPSLDKRPAPVGSDRLTALTMGRQPLVCECHLSGFWGCSEFLLVMRKYGIVCAQDTCLTMVSPDPGRGCTRGGRGVGGMHADPSLRAAMDMSNDIF